MICASVLKQRGPLCDCPVGKDDPVPQSERYWETDKSALFPLKVAPSAEPTQWLYKAGPTLANCVNASPCETIPRLLAHHLNPRM